MNTAGIIGLNWGLVHLYNLRSLGMRVDVVCAETRANAERVASEHGVPRATADLDALNDVDLVVVATPPAPREAP